MMNATLRGKPDAGNPHVRFDEGEVAPAKPRRGSLLYTKCTLIGGAALCAAAGLWVGASFAGPNGMENSATALTYTRTALWPGFDGKYCKMCPSVATDGQGLAFMTYGMLLLTGSDVFCGSYISKSTDGGETWSTPRAVTEFPDTREHGLRVTRSCGPRYNRKHDLWFGLGSAATYENDRVPCLKVIDGRPYGWPLCAKFDPKTGKFSNAVKINFPLPYARVYPFGQMVELDDGDMLVPFNWEPLEKAQNKNDGYSVFGRIVIARCRVDQDGFRIVEIGKPVAGDGLRRGVGEPSLIRLGKEFYLTLRSDEYGMWCASDDGLNFSAPKRWTWTDDGKEIGNRNTQQHWMKVGGKLYLAYTRVTPTNGHVFRNRAPVFLAEFDPSRGGLVRGTEMSLVPERGARLGNFCCTEDGHGGSWLVTAEWMQPIGCEKYGSDNSIWFVKVSERPAAKFQRPTVSPSGSAADSRYTVSDAEVFVDNRSRGRSGHMGHALIDCGRGRILAFNSNVPTNRCDGHSGYGWMEYRVSKDYGRSWGAARVLDYSMKVFKEGKHTALCEKGVRAPDGRIILFFQITDASRPISCEPWFEPTYIESRDGGETWSDARVACSERGRIYDAVVDRDSVYFLLPTSPNFCDTNQEYVVYKSTNGGPFVRHVTSVEGAKKGYGAMEFAPDGSLVVYAYDSLDEAHPQYCVSRDRGVTWEKPGRCACAKLIRNPQVRRIGDDWFMCGRNGGSGDGLVLYRSKNGIDWDEGVKIAQRPDGTGTGFYSCLLPILEPGRPPRLLLQYSRPYWSQCVNVEHRWIEPRPVDVSIK